MSTTNLQIPIDKTLKENATAVAKEYGFSSLQEITRVLLTKLSKRELNFEIKEEKVVRLSPEAEARYTKMEEDFKKGKNFYTANSVDELMEDLHGD